MVVVVVVVFLRLMVRGSENEWLSYYMLYAVGGVGAGKSCLCVPVAERHWCQLMVSVDVILFFGFPRESTMS